MSKRVWDKYLSERDKEIFAGAFGGVTGFGERPALLVIDAAWAFIGDKREPIREMVKRWPMGSGEEGWNAVDHIKPLIETFRSKKMPVIYTIYGRRKDGWDKTSWIWKNPNTAKPPPTNRPDLDINDVVSDIAPAPQDIVVRKQKASGFFETNLASYLTWLGADSVVVTGGVTSGCVRATVVDAFSLNYKVSIVEEACFDRAEASHALNLFDMNTKYADVVTGEAVQKHLRTLPDNLFPRLPSG